MIALLCAMRGEKTKANARPGKGAEAVPALIVARMARLPVRVTRHSPT